MNPDGEKRLVACHGCGLAHAVGNIKPGYIARCMRCGEALAGATRLTMNEHLMLYLVAAILFLVAQLFPFMMLEFEGRRQVTTIFDGVRVLHQDGAPLLALTVFLTGTLAPALRIGLAIAVYLPLACGRMPRQIVGLMRLLKRIRPWAMMEIYLFAVIIAYVKLIDFAEIETGVALFAFVSVILILTLLDGDHEPQDIWQLVEPQASVNNRRLAGSYAVCHQCQQINDPGLHRCCTRCSAPVHVRRPASLIFSWALLIAALIMLLPANLLPIITVTSFGSVSASTIMGGVVELIEQGMYPVAAVVFIASIAVPALKVVGLAYIYASVTFGWRVAARDRAVMYRVIEAIGRWSMIDIFVIALLAALVALGNVATIEAGPAALCFSAAVIISMLSAMSFDPRLIWDDSQRQDMQDG